MQVHTDCAISVSLQHEDPLCLDDGDRGLFHLPCYRMIPAAFSYRPYLSQTLADSFLATQDIQFKPE